MKNLTSKVAKIIGLLLGMNAGAQASELDVFADAQVQVIVISEREYRLGSSSGNLVDRGADTISITPSLYNELKKRGRIKVLENADTDNCGGQDCTITD